MEQIDMELKSTGTTSAFEELPPVSNEERVSVPKSRTGLWALLVVVAFVVGLVLGVLVSWGLLAMLVMFSVVVAG